MEGVYELHYRQLEFGELDLVLYQHLNNGHLRLVDSRRPGPFEPVRETGLWLSRALRRDGVLPTA